MKRLFALLIFSTFLLAACAAGPEDAEPAVQAEVPAAEPTVVSEQAESEAQQPPEPAPVDDFWVQFSAPVTARGEVIIITGIVLDADGTPLPGAAVQFWQTDEDGIYDHPGDGSTADRDLGFQFYGQSVADAEGRYAFRTVLPGQYEPRPPHTHVKVFVDGRAVLITQLYFPGLGAQGGLGPGADQLVLAFEDAAAPDGSVVPWAEFNFVVDTGSGGSLALTPAQGEGPYYPLVDVSLLDNDLASVEP